MNEFLTACERQKNKKGGEYFDKQLLGKGRGQNGDFLPRSALDFAVFYVILCIHINLLFASARFLIFIKRKRLRRFRRKAYEIIKT